jgi:hypothetical protein
VIEAAGGDIRTRPGDEQAPDAVIEGGPHEVLAVLSGQLDLAAARGRGLNVEGDASALARLKPRALT